MHRAVKGIHIHMQNNPAARRIILIHVLHKIYLLLFMDSTVKISIPLPYAGGQPDHLAPLIKFFVTFPRKNAII
ncbi:hypothetical protein D3C73_1529630 [compost metagenome]